MKKILSKFWEFCTSRFLQTLLLIVAFNSWEAVERIGTRTRQVIGQGEEYTKSSKGFDTIMSTADVDVAVTSGYNGGALAMGLITCVCILGVVWLEINRSKKP